MVSLSLYGHLEIHLQTMVVFLIRVRLDVDIGGFGIKWVQYQFIHDIEMTTIRILLFG